MTHITFRLTAKNRDQLRNPTLGNRVWAAFSFIDTAGIVCVAGSMLALLCSSVRPYHPSAARGYGRFAAVGSAVWDIDPLQHGRRRSRAGPQQQMRAVPRLPPTYRKVNTLFTKHWTSCRDYFLPDERDFVDKLRGATCEQIWTFSTRTAELLYSIFRIRIPLLALPA